MSTEEQADAAPPPAQADDTAVASGPQADAAPPPAQADDTAVASGPQADAAPPPAQADDTAVASGPQADAAPPPAQADDTAVASGPQADAAPPPAQADDKDWTWVLDRPCPDCGADVGDLSIAEVAALNRSDAAAWAELLASDADVRTRPSPEVWSTLEYAAHVRDVFELFLVRLELMLNEDNPLFANWNPNETAESERYDLQDPAQVSDGLVEAAHALADRFEQLTDDQLDRPGRRSDGAEFSVLTFARYEIHDPMHHLWDVTGEWQGPSS